MARNHGLDLFCGAGGLPMAALMEAGMKWNESLSDSEIVRTLGWDPSVENAKAMEMHLLAKSFIRDARRLGNSYSAGQYVLFIQGIELALKAYLHERGLTLKELYDYKHDLDALLHAARALGLKPTARETTSVLRRLNKTNEHAALRYNFAFAAPLAEEVAHIADALLSDTAPEYPKHGTA